MAWYNGTVAEAIAESKRSSKLFVVFVTGKAAFLIDPPDYLRKMLFLNSFIFFEG